MQILKKKAPNVNMMHSILLFMVHYVSAGKIVVRSLCLAKDSWLFWKEWTQCRPLVS